MKETGKRDPAETCFNVSGRGRSDECGEGRESLRRVGNWGCRSKSEDANALLAHALWERILHRKFFKDSYLSFIFDHRKYSEKGHQQVFPSLIYDIGFYALLCMESKKITFIIMFMSTTMYIA